MTDPRLIAVAAPRVGLRRNRIGALIVGDALVLWALWPSLFHLTALVGNLRRPYAWVAADGADAAVAELVEPVLWLVAAWLAIGLTAAAAAAVPGRVGILSAGVARATLPAFVQRALAGSLGLSLAFTPLAASARAAAVAPSAVVATPAAAAASAPGATPSVPGAPALPRTVSVSVSVSVPLPRTPTVSAPLPGTPAVSAPLPRTPTVSAPLPTSTVPGQPQDRQPPTSPPTTSTGPGTAPHRPSSATPPPVDGTETPKSSSGPRDVVVRRGDSLWAIAASRLGPAARPGEIAAAWPSWYRRNRAVIGTDPDLLYPGERLRAPTDTPHSARWLPAPKLPGKGS